MIWRVTAVFLEEWELKLKSLAPLEKARHDYSAFNPSNRGRDRQIPRAHWPVRLAKISSSVRDPVWTDLVPCSGFPVCTLNTHMHAHTHYQAHTPKTKQKNPPSENRQNIKLNGLSFKNCLYKQGTWKKEKQINRKLFQHMHIFS